MKGMALTLSLTALALVGGRSKNETEAMAGMAMGGGGDTAVARQPVRLTPAQGQAIGITYTVVERGPLQRNRGSPK